MIQFFRSFFKSKLGLAITFVFIGLIALAFASSDVAGTGTFGGVSGGDRVAIVGDEKIGTAELARTTSSALDQVRREDPTVSMQAFVENGGLEGVLDRLIDRYAVGAYAEMHGLRAGNNLINSEIVSIPAFRGPDGNFSQDVYQQAIRQQNLTDALLRQDLGSGLLQQQLMGPSLISTNVPSKIATRYASLLKERRQGSVALLPSAAFAPSGDPSDAALNGFYEENRSRYIRPERRVIRYASFGIGAVDSSVTPTEAEIAARYQRDAEEYSAKETRQLTQLIVPTQDAANSLRQQVQAGSSLEAVARGAGFSTTQVGPVDQSDYAGASSEAVASAVFAAPRGSIAAPARSPLGWHLVRVENVDRTAARSLAQVSSRIREQLLVEKRNEALADLSARVEEQIDSGAALSEVADELDIQISTTPALTADGRVYGQQGRGVPDQLRGTIDTAFQMEEGDPQLAEIVRGQTFLVFEVSDITPSATAPLNEIRDRVLAEWRLSEGSRLAKEAADRVIGKLGDSPTLAAALRQEEVNLPPVENVDLNRQQLIANPNQQVPAPLVLLFSMAQGTTKRLEAPNDLGWFVVDLDEISVDPITNDDPLVNAAQQQLRAGIGEEYRRQMLAAIREEVGVERNENAVEAVRKQLVGVN